MDSLWMLEVNGGALLLIAPTMLCNLLALRYARGLRENLVTGAMNCWLAMNVAWMTGEILGIGPLYLAAKAFTAVGTTLLVLVVIHAYRTGAPWYEWLRRFRRLRIPSSGGGPR